MFQGVGKLKNRQVNLHIDKTIQPIAQPHRRIPFHVRKLVEKKLEALEKANIIEKATGPTPWVSPLVIVPKPKNPDDICICVDMIHPTKPESVNATSPKPGIKEITTDPNKACVFLKLDLNQGYHQVEVAEESRYITTFSTHLGLRRYKRLNFEVTSATEIFQNVIRETLEGILGTINISDDILVYGKSQEEHDSNLNATLQRLKHRNLTINKAKCGFNKRSVEYFGYKFSTEGISPDPRKVEVIKKAKPPSNPTEVRSLLGMVNFCTRFIFNLATLAQPLRHSTKNNSKWNWSTTEQQVLDIEINKDVL